MLKTVLLSLLGHASSHSGSRCADPGRLQARQLPVHDERPDQCAAGWIYPLIADSRGPDRLVALGKKDPAMKRSFVARKLVRARPMLGPATRMSARASMRITSKPPLPSRVALKLDLPQALRGA